MESHQIAFRPVKEGELSQAAGLMNAEYARKKNEQYFRWQYSESYYPTVLFGSFEGDTLIGMFGLQKKLLSNGAAAGQALDLLMVPPWRGKGVFRKLAARALSHFTGLDLYCVFPNAAGKRACEKSLGWLTVAKINSLTVSRSQFTMNNLPPLSQTTLQTPLTRFSHSDQFHHWRFDRNAEYAYQYVRHSSHAYAVTKLFVDPVQGTKYGDIVDMEYGDNDSSTAQKLYIRACESLFMQGVDVITTWALPHTLLYHVAQSVGFAVRPRERYFCTQILNDRYRPFSNITNWCFMQADCEIY